MLIVSNVSISVKPLVRRYLWRRDMVVLFWPLLRETHCLRTHLKYVT